MAFSTFAIVGRWWTLYSPSCIAGFGATRNSYDYEFPIC